MTHHLNYSSFRSKWEDPVHQPADNIHRSPHLYSGWGPLYWLQQTEGHHGASRRYSTNLSLGSFLLFFAGPVKDVSSVFLCSQLWLRSISTHWTTWGGFWRNHQLPRFVIEPLSEHPLCVCVCVCVCVVNELEILKFCFLNERTIDEKQSWWC